ncbi:MAG: SDR family NAD(P)-dependent oxidoreductase, partial [Mycoplasmatales bacterium]
MKKICIITGANTGLGFETAKSLLNNGYHVILACRDQNKARIAIIKLKETKKTDATLEYMNLDLINYDSVREFVDLFKSKYNHLDLLINNAGVMMPPYTVTNNKQELQFDANHLGHFLLTGLLVESLEKSPDPKVVVVSSLAHKQKNSNIHFDDITFSNGYNGFEAYCQSKLANAIFGITLSEKYPNIKTVIAHPGVSDTDLSRYFKKYLMILRPLVKLILPISNPETGSQSIIMAALDKTLKSG